MRQIQQEHTNAGSGTEVVEEELSKLEYTYDANGNIETIKEGGVLKGTYTYDGLNQLIREDNRWVNRSITYTYDQGGNLTGKKEYAYTTGELGTVKKTVPYSYGDSNWKDKLTSYDGKAITYDAIGNPLTYDGYTYTWQKGRQLKSISGNGQSLSFQYNADGLRTKKTAGSKATEYLYAGGLLISQTDGTDTLSYLYAPNGEMLGVRRNQYNYYFMRNVQGDVIGLYNCYGEINSRYVYDSWGKLISVTDANGNAITSETHIANLNPIRYRGYYYDTETGLYYLQSRYYDPEIGRFLNADKYISTGQGLNGCSMFTYCGNNPINNLDPTGSSFISWMKNSLNNAKSYVKTVSKKIGKSTLSFLKSFTASFGYGTGFRGSASVGNITISGGIKMDLENIRYSKGKFDIGKEGLYGYSIGLKGVDALSLDKQEGFFHSDLCEKYKTDGDHNIDTCPKAEIYDDNFSPNFTLVSVDVYFIIGVSCSVGFDYKYFAQDLEVIWDEK